jgi:hypothetical protein
MEATAKLIVAAFENADRLPQYFIRLEKYIRTSFLVQAVASSDLIPALRIKVISAGLSSR